MAVNLTTSYQRLFDKTGGSDGYHTWHLRAYAKYRDQSVTANTSIIDVQVRIYVETTNGGSGYNNNSYAYTCKIDGTTVTSGNYTQGTINAGAEKPLFTSSRTVTHAADGSYTGKTIAVTGYAYATAVSGSETVNVPTIPRASTCSVSPNPLIVNGTNGLTITTNRKSDSFTHTIVIKRGSTTITTINDVGASTVWKPAASVFSTVTDSSTIDCTLTCTTYSGSTQIGSATTATFKLQADRDTFKPTLSGQKATETTMSSYSVTGWNVLRFLSSKTVEVTVAGKQNATIVSVICSVGGKSVSLTKSSSGNVWSGSIAGVTDAEFTFTATDSRGIVNTLEVSGTLYPYSYPTIETLVVTRTSETSDTGSLIVTGTYWNATTPKKNTVTFTYTKNNGSASSAQTPTMSGANWNKTISNITGLTTTQSFKYTVTATDAYGQTIEKSFTLAAATDTIWIGRSTIRVQDEIIENRLAILNDGQLNGYLDGTKFGQLLYLNSGAKQLSTGANALLVAANIPSLAASKITSGTFALARIPALSSEKISGTFTRTDSSFKFPDGTMIQWGSLSVPNNSTQTKSFPTAFDNSCLAMWATSNQAGFGAVSTVAVKATSKSQFQISQYNNASASMTVEWVAIGY